MWVFGARLMTQVSGIFILVFAGRLLGPAILGSFVLVSAVVELLRMVARAGWRDYLLSETGRANDVQISALCALLFASIAAIVGLLGSVIMRIVISDPVYANLLAVLSILVPFEAVSFVMAGILIRTGRIIRNAQIQCIGEAIGLTLGLWALFSGFGLYALALAKVAYLITVFVGQWLVTRLSITLQVDKEGVLDALKFSKSVFSVNMLGYLRNHGSSYIIGFLIGPASVGFFRIAARMMAAANEMINEVARILSWAELGEFKKRSTSGLDEAARAGIARMFTVQVGTVTIAAAAVYLGIAAIGSNLVPLILGPGWEPTIVVMFWLAFARFIVAPINLLMPVLSIIGRIELLPKLQAAIIVIQFVGLVIGAQYGIREIAIAEVIVAIPSIGLAYYIAANVVGLDKKTYVSTYLIPSIIAGMSMILIIYFSSAYLVEAIPSLALNNSVMLPIKVGIGAAVYTGLLYLLSPKVVRSLIGK